MAGGNSPLPSMQQYEELKIPSEWTGEQRRFAQRLIGIIDDIYRKYGRFELSDLGKGLRQWVDGVDGSMLEIIESAAGLSVRVTNAEGNISQIILTADELAARVSNAEGDISLVQQTAQSIITRVENAEGDISEVRQTAQGLLSRVADAEGNISQVAQTALSLVARVTDAEGSITEIALTTDGIAAAVKNNRLRFSERGLEIINAAGEVVFRQDNVTGDLTITGIIRALGGIIGGFTITEDSLRTSTAEISSTGNGYARFGQLLITDSLSSGPVLEALAGLSVIIGGALYMALGNNGVTMNRTLYAQSGLYVNPSRTTDKPANLYVDPSTGEVYRTVNTGSGDGGGGTPGTGLAASISMSSYTITNAQMVEIYGGATGGKAPYEYSFAVSYEGGAYQTIGGAGGFRTYQPSTPGRYTFRVVVTDADGTTAVAHTSQLTVTGSANALTASIGMTYVQLSGGKNVTWTVYVSGGSGAYLYSVTLRKDGSLLQYYATQPVSTFLSAPGTYYVDVNVVDEITYAVTNVTGGYITI